MKTSREIAKRTFSAEIAENETASRLLDAAHDVTTAAEDARKSLIAEVEWLIDNLNQSLTKLQAGETVNSLGIIQSRGSTIDRLCGELALATSLTGKVQHAAERAGLLV